MSRARHAASPRQPDPALPDDSLVAILRGRAAATPERLTLRFLTDGRAVGATLDYAELDRRVRALAARLQRDAEPGARALIALPSGPDYVVAFFACLYAGLVAVPCYPPETRDPHHAARLALMIADMAPDHVLTDRANRETVAATCAGATVRDIVCVDAVGTAGAAAWRPVPCTPDTLAFLQYTSGSTANPKGVEVTHGNIVANARWLAEAIAPGADDVFVSWLPLYHDMGLIAGLIEPIFAGTPLVLMSPQAFLSRPAAWLEAIGTHGGTISGGPDFAYRLACERVGAAAVAGLDLGAWRIAYSGSEPIRPDTLTRFAARFAPAGFAPTALNPAYGLAEATLLVTCKPRGTPWRRLSVAPAPLAAGRAVADEAGIALASSGRPIRPEHLRVVDPRSGLPCPAGTVGEIWLSGPCIARGYWRNPEATRATFVTRDGARWLRTGDLGFLDGGELFVTGRLKDLIILRGHNVYPQDVETAVEARVPALRPGRIAAFAVEGPAGEGIGIAAEIGRSAASRAPEIAAAVDAALAEVLREPADLIALLAPGSLPKTTSGKLRRGACRDGLAAGDIEPLHLYRRQQGGASPDEPPRTPTERALAAIWCDLLGLDQVSRGRGFLELGGHSLLAMRAVDRVRAAFGVALPLRDLFAAPTLADLAARIDALPRDAAEAPALLPSAEAPVLSLGQQRLWLAERLGDPAERGAYVMTGHIRFAGPLEPDRLIAALHRVIARQAVLRTGYPIAEDGLPEPRIAETVTLDIPRDDLAGLDPAAREIRVAESAAAEARRPFDLARPPLLRARLLRLAADDHRLVLALHHLVGDGWSVGVLLTELGAAYRGAEAAPLPAQYADFARWHRAAVEQAAAAETAFWRGHLAGVPALLPLPTDRPRPSVLSQAGGSVRFTLPGPLVAQLSELGRTRGASPFVVLLAGFQALLHRLSGAERFVVGTDVAGRPVPALAGLIGFFVNVLPIRARLDGAPSFATLIERVRDDVLAAFDHATLPFDRIVDALAIPRARARPPLVQALFVMQNAPPGDFGVAGITAEVRAAGAHGSKFEMALFLDPPEPGGGIAAEWVFATALFTPDRVARLAEAYAALLAAAAATPASPLSTLLPSLPALLPTLLPTLPPSRDPEDSVMSNAASPLPRAGRLEAKLDKLKGLGAGKPAAAEAGEPARLSTLAPGRDFPLVIEPLSADVDAVAWAAAQRGWVEGKLRRHAGLLLRGFGIASPQEFEAFAEALQPGLYGGYGDLPKNEGGKNTYRSTPYPEREMILYHNESSHLHAWPRKQWFFCQQPSPVGGATPIVDCRDLYRRLPQEIAARFERLGLIYVRTFTERFDVDWRRFFHTEDRAAVEARCRAEGVDFAWLDADTLQTRTRCPAVITHPLTGEKSFFNQVQLHHPRCLDPEVRADLLSLVGPERMPRDVLYGDGTPIEDAVMDEVGRLYEAIAVRFDWRPGDVVMLDNMLAAHARDPYEGPRRIVVAMGDMVARSAVSGAAA
ncbi:Acyl-CoA synthetase (AMP-forming)/AMP-acid ligase II [Methylobacterium sp. UNC378MF]|uniref:condensation domain-containing protein n=1 Tax=Methylobacterium sp. UNC378MF TaxID=1502748 RepID=UPI0008821AEA|nr:TauD/TfdA family dioxygenase [Methylobacterium sp. UNC378MF]SDA33917.1 Acyl-CoA synthetase (AMP-forming)/AMP-acid ligase II [Methylobacterium sp. UNC378MF]